METRLLCADMVEVEWTDSQGVLKISTALLEDISSMGVCLQLETPLPLFAVVLVNLNGIHTQAMVRYCSWKEIGYFAGLTFAPGARWSRERFQPKHLTNPFSLEPSMPERVV